MPEIKTHLFNSVGNHNNVDLSDLCRCGKDIDHMLHKECEMIGCKNKSIRMYQIAPGTNIHICQECIIREEEQYEG